MRIFNSDGLALDVHLQHECSNPHHVHRKQPPYFLKHFENRILNNNVMTVPRKFVYDHALHQYSIAVLRYQQLTYGVPLRVSTDANDPDDKTQLHMITDWQLFLNETGLTMECVEV